MSEPHNIGISPGSDKMQAAAAIAQASGLPIAQLAFNSAVMACSPTEITAFVSFLQRPLALLILSPVMAKTFAHDLLDKVAEYEQLTGTSVRTVAEILASKLSEQPVP